MMRHLKDHAVLYIVALLALVTMKVTDPEPDAEPEPWTPPSLPTFPRIVNVHAVDRDTALIVWSDPDVGHVLTRSDPTGRSRWSQRFDGWIARELHVLDTVILLEYKARTDRELVAMVSLDGTRRWEHRKRSWERCDVAYEIVDHIVCVSLKGEPVRIVAYDIHTGEVAWTAVGPFETSRAFVFGHGVIDGRGVFVDARDGKARVLGSGGCGANGTYVRIDAANDVMYLYREGSLSPSRHPSPFTLPWQPSCAIYRGRLVLLGTDDDGDVAVVLDGERVERRIRIEGASRVGGFSGEVSRFAVVRDYHHDFAPFAVIDLEEGRLTRLDLDRAVWGSRLRAGRMSIFTEVWGTFRTFDGATGRFGRWGRYKDLKQHMIAADRIWMFDEGRHPPGTWPWPSLRVVDAVTLEPVEPPKRTEEKDRATGQ